MAMPGFECEILLPLPRMLRLEVSTITLISAYFLKVYRYFVCTFLYTMCMQWLSGPKECSRSPSTGVTDSC